MKRQMFGALASLAVAATLVTAQVNGQEPQQQQQTPEVALTGCLIQGSAPTVFILDKARANPENREDPGVSYVLVSQIEDTDLTQFLNHQVRITGTPEPKEMDPEREQTEKDLPKLTAKAIVNIADTCPTAF
jgi:hypothetical protein